jgi:putative transposase
MKFAFVAKHRQVWPMAWLCKALDVSTSGFHDWLNRKPAKRTLENGSLLGVIRQSCHDSDRTYGARRVWKDVVAEGVSCGLHRIERLMHENALKARPRRRRLPSDTGLGSVRNLVRGAIVIARRESHGYRERTVGSAFGWS